MKNPIKLTKLEIDTLIQHTETDLGYYECGTYNCPAKDDGSYPAVEDEKRVIL